MTMQTARAWRVLVVEARSGLVLAFTVLAVSFLSYSAIAGVVGGGAGRAARGGPPRRGSPGWSSPSR